MNSTHSGDEVSGRVTDESRIRRFLSLAPMPPTESVVVAATGAGLWIAAVATTRPSWAPWWVGWALTAVSVALVARGVLGGAGALASSLRAVIRSRGWRGNRVPRTADEVAEVREKRPLGWEYLYFAGCLFVARAALEASFLDHELRYAEPSEERVDEDDVGPYLQAANNQVLAIVARLMSLMAREVQERAFGREGQEGDADRIRHLAERWTSVYGDLMRWAARLRGVNKPDAFRNLFERQAQLIDQPIRQYRDFVDTFVQAADRIPDALRTKQPLLIDLKLTLSVDEEAERALHDEIERLVRLQNVGIEWDDPEREEERESIQSDARRLVMTLNAMAGLNGVEDTDANTRRDLKERIDGLQKRTDAHWQKWGTRPSGPAGFVHDESGQGPDWLRSMVKSLDYMIWQLDQEG